MAKKKKTTKKVAEPKEKAKKPTKKVVKTKEIEVSPGLTANETEINLDNLTDEQIRNIQLNVIQQTLNQSSAIQVIAKYLAASLFDQGGTPLLPALITNQVVLGQQLGAIVNGSYVKTSDYNALAQRSKQFEDAYNSVAAQVQKLQAENAQMAQALQQQTALQHQGIGVR